MFCKYKNIFGEVNKGIHSIRFFDFAIVDILGTIVIAIIIHIIYPECELGYLIIFLFLLGIVLHKLFCVKTKLNSILFDD